jgi:hypothetical protein
MIWRDGTVSCAAPALGNTRQHPATPREPAPRNTPEEPSTKAITERPV